jgi:hypothetical protein
MVGMLPVGSDRVRAVTRYGITARDVEDVVADIRRMATTA